MLHFDHNIWLCILVSISALTLIWHYIEKQGIIISFFFHYQLLVESGSLSVSKITKTPSRVLTVASVFAFLTISTIFKSEMLNSLTETLYEYQINSLDDIIRHNLKCYVADDMKLLYKSISNFYSRYISKCTSIEDHDDQQEILVRTVLNKDVATISRFLKLRFAMNTLLEMGYEKERPHLIRRQVKFDFLFLYLTKGYPLYDRLCEILGRMDSGGFTSYFRKLVDFKVDKALKFKQKIQTRNLEFAHISIAFYIFLAGMGGSFVVFLFEVAVKRPLSAL
mgnify:CR=1 FL=1